ncbi:MAG TPA: carbohydrate-binding family 9-like protein [Bryobacteraceae bacterium]|nr:carbohydrate-binding family 9-like protein [Bryobacteraceae bacterium]
MRLCAFFFIGAALLAGGDGRIESHYSKRDYGLTANPEARHWKKVKGIVASNDGFGAPVKNHDTEVRSLWTDKNLYLLFICPYEALNLKPQPSTTKETNKLWDWDVAEAFIGTDFERIRHYREFQVSPQGEWVDLDIDRDHPLPEGGWMWNSGFTVKARLDEAKKIWYGEMKIPMAGIDTRKPRAGNEMRINFYRIQGPGPKRVGIAWQKTGAASYHVPEAFGTLVLAPK